MSDVSPESAARAAGLVVFHSDGCPGVYLPGIGLLIDTGLPEEDRRETVRAILEHVDRER